MSEFPLGIPHDKCLFEGPSPGIPCAGVFDRHLLNKCLTHSVPWGSSSHTQKRALDSTVPKPKVLFCFCFVFLVSLLVAFGWPRQGGQSCQASSRRCRLAWSQKHRHRPARRRLRGEAAFSQFHPLASTIRNTHHSHTHPPSSVFS